MKNNSKKKFYAMLSAAVVSIFFALVFVFPAMDYGFSNHFRKHHDVYPMIVGLVGIVLILCMVYLVKQRFNELDSGQEDDIDQY